MRIGASHKLLWDAGPCMFLNHFNNFENCSYLKEKFTCSQDCQSSVAQNDCLSCAAGIGNTVCAVGDHNEQA